MRYFCAICRNFSENGKNEKISVDNGIGWVYNKSVNKRCLCYKGEGIIMKIKTLPKDVCLEVSKLVNAPNSDNWEKERLLWFLPDEVFNTELEVELGQYGFHMINGDDWYIPTFFTFGVE